MIVYRLSKQIYINDLSGAGSERTGGRWNSKGVPILYTSASMALAVVEIAVHVPFGIIPVNYHMASIFIPDEGITTINTDDLSENWNKNPFTKSTQNIGDDFIKSNKHLIFKVPSATVAGDHNYLINPRHPDFKKVKIKSTWPFEFDIRLFKK